MADEDLAVRALCAVGFNGFGFQTDDGVSPPGYMVLAFLSRPVPKGNLIMAWPDGPAPIHVNHETVRLQAHFASNRMAVDDFLGHKFIKLHWTEYQRIPEVLQYFLDHDFNLQLRNTLKVVYEAGERFLPLEMEARFIRNFRQYMVDCTAWCPRYTTPQAYALKAFGTDRLLVERNWATPEGRAFCRELQTYVEPELYWSDVKLDVMRWEGVDRVLRRYRLLQYGTWWWVPPVAVEGPEDPAVDGPEQKASEPPAQPPPRMIGPDEAEQPLQPPLCVLCEENPSNTRVLPCEHMVVCHACSDRLKPTNDRCLCVQCRQPIALVLCDGREPEEREA